MIDRREARRLAARLLHDVGKYVARTARNLDGAPGDDELLAMLRRDLYALPGGRASQVLASLAPPLAAHAPAEIARASELLAEADRLEPALAAGDRAAAARVVAIALAVEQALRAAAEALA